AGLVPTSVRPLASTAQESATGGTYPPGSVLLTSFRIEDLVASGGMGSVYRATHLVTGATVAVKTIRPEYAADATMGELFRREAQALRRIAHPAIVRYEGAFSADDGHMVLVMEYVDGPSLTEVLRKGALPPASVLVLRDRLAAGLAAAHREGVVHRDLSPDNVILPGGRIEEAKIIDFGIARQERAEGATLVGGDFAGKLAWAAPEQFGLFGGNVDHRADIFSLGLVLAAAACGRPLEMGASMTRAVLARNNDPDLTPVPAPLRTELARMLRCDPAQRLESMAALLPTESAAATSGARRWRWLAGAAVLVAMAATGISVLEVEKHDHLFGHWLGRSPPTSQPPGVRDAETTRDTAIHKAPPTAGAIEIRYGGSACHGGNDTPCSTGVVTVRHGRAIGSWPAADDRLTNIVEGSIDAGGVLRLRWRRIDASDNLMDQAHLTGTVTDAGLRVAGKWANRGSDVELVWSRLD
ncbi:MAG TPA: serine/threonine-protein kinase, partial [Vineibacter sp.]|nr:serine/threonine-protein kinase [Vineibacter sp.]